MTKQSIAQQVKQEFQNKKRQAELVAEQNIDELKKDKEFASIYLNYNLQNLNLAKIKHSFVSNKSTDENSLKTAENNLKTAHDKLLDYLSRHNIPLSFITPNYSCKKCQDSGILNGKLCDCLSKEISQRFRSSNSSYQNFHTFDMCNPNKMTPASEKIFKEMYDWCNTFPNDILNITLLGNSGTGKTFLLECITQKLIDRNFNVIFLTAFDFNEECRKYHCSQPSKLDSYLSCDALIIDDLGTEPVLKNITAEYFYNVVNLRQINHKATLISTNLSPVSLEQRYSMRTLSRLNNKSISKAYMFASTDKRTY